MTPQPQAQKKSHLVLALLLQAGRIARSSVRRFKCHNAVAHCRHLERRRQVRLAQQLQASRVKEGALAVSSRQPSRWSQAVLAQVQMQPPPRPPLLPWSAVYNSNLPAPRRRCCCYVAAAHLGESPRRTLLHHLRPQRIGRPHQPLAAAAAAVAVAAAAGSQGVTRAQLAEC